MLPPTSKAVRLSPEILIISNNATGLPESRFLAGSSGE